MTKATSAVNSNGAAGIAVMVTMGGLAVASPTLAVGPWLVVIAWKRWAQLASADAEQRQLHAELPPFLDALAQRMVAGGSLSQALQATPAGPAVAARLRPMTIGLSLGLGLQASIGVLRSRQATAHNRSSAFDLLVDTFSILIARGGRALPSIERLNDTIRSAVWIDDEIHVHAGQAKASAMMLAALPFLFAVGLAALDRRLAHLYLYEPIGTAYLTIAFGLSYGSWRWMNRLARPSRRPTAETNRDRPPGSGWNAKRTIVIGPVALLSLGVALVDSFAVAIGLAVSLALGARFVARRQANAAGRALAGELPEAIDLCTVVLGAGGTIRDCVTALATSGPALVRMSAIEAVARTERGDRLDQALRWLQLELGPTFQPLTGALLVAQEQGGGIGELLARLSVEAGASRRRVGELRARQLPVALLLPLVTCSLPAVIIGAVVPLATVAIDGIQLDGAPLRGSG